MKEFNISTSLYDLVSKHYKIKEGSKPLYSITLGSEGTVHIEKIPIIEFGDKEDNVYLGSHNLFNRDRLPIPLLSRLTLNRYYGNENLFLNGLDGLYCYNLKEGIESVKEYVKSSKSMMVRYKLLCLYHLSCSELDIQSISIFKTLGCYYITVVQVKDKSGDYRTECYLINIDYEILKGLSIKSKDTKEYLKDNISLLCDIAKGTEVSTVINYTDKERL